MPSDVPPQQERKDVNTRALVDALARHLKAELGSVNEKLDQLEAQTVALQAREKNSVTWQQALIGCAAVAVTLFGGAWALIAKAEQAAKDAGADAMEVAKEAQRAQKELETFVKQDLREMRSEQKADMQELKSELRNATKAVERTAPVRRPPPRRETSGGSYDAGPRIGPSP